MQINTDVKNLIYEKLLELASGGNVVDAYAGAALLSANLCKQSKKVYAIEISKQSCEDALELKNRQKIDNLIIKNGDCAEILPIICQNDKIDTIVLDPPRKGCDEKVLSTILKVLPKQIIYLSCNSSTLARDLKLLLKNNNYDIIFVQPYDMFAWSSDVETLVYLREKNANKK